MNEKCFGVSSPNEISAIVKAVAPKPVNVLVSGFNRELTVAQLTDLGVRRISIGSALSSVAWGAITRAVREIADRGTFQCFAEAASFAEINQLFAKPKVTKDAGPMGRARQRDA